MGLITRLLSYSKEWVKLDAGGRILSSQHTQPANHDSAPLPGDTAITVDVQPTGGQVSVAYADGTERKAQPGESRIYARSGDGRVVSEIHLKSDGSITLTNDGGLLTLEADGTVKINGASIDPDGAISSPVSVTSPSIKAGGKELANHIHPAGMPRHNRSQPLTDILMHHSSDGGQIDGTAMTNGYQTAVYLSLFGGDMDDDGLCDCVGWWGNLSETDPQKRYRSQTQHIIEYLPATTANLKRLEDAVKADLDWMDSLGVQVTISVSLVSVRTVSIVIAIAGDGDVQHFYILEAWGIGNTDNRRDIAACSVCD